MSPTVVITDKQGNQTGIYHAPHDPELLEICVKLSNLPMETRETHRLYSWKSIHSLEVAFNKCKEFAFEQPPHHFLTLIGERGLGKTHLSIATLWEFIEQERGNGCYWQVGALLDYLRSTYNRYEKSKEGGIEVALNWLEKCGLLILDDLGVEKQTEWSTEKLDEIVDSRYINKKLTIFTTNVTPDTLPPRIVDRMFEGQVITLKAPSYRRRKKEWTI